MPFCGTRIRSSLKSLKEKESTVSSISFSNVEDQDSDVCRGIIRTFPTLATFSLMYLKSYIQIHSMKINMTSMQVLFLENNSLTGTIPDLDDTRKLGQSNRSPTLL